MVGNMPNVGISSSQILRVIKMKQDRILIISHGHPDLSKGGAEVASYNLFKEYKKNGLDVVYLARTDGPSHGGTVFSSRNSGNEILFHTGIGDLFLFESVYKKHIWGEFREFLKTYKPTVVHFHHYVHLGLEAIREVKNTLPDTRIIFTLHEYLAICAHNGQMVKPGLAMALCHKSSASDCSRCFPERTSADFFLREKYIKSIFNLVDKFISPSHFLIERYKSWGLPQDKMIMIENGQPEASKLPPRQLAEGEVRGRFAYFGQINPFKGVDVLLEAFLCLSKKIKRQVHLDLYGANLNAQSQDYQNKVHALIEKLGDIVTYHGSYEPKEMPSLIEQCDWVIVPSIWWENSPMVIQESLNYGRPVIGSDIGGMLEKIDGQGILFRARSPIELSKKIESSLDIDKYDQYYASITKPLSISECAVLHQKIYFTAV